MFAQLDLCDVARGATCARQGQHVQAGTRLAHLQAAQEAIGASGDATIVSPYLRGKGR